MGLRRLKTTTHPDDVLEEHVHCYAMTCADPNAVALAPKFDGLIQDWKARNVEHIDLIVAAATAAAKVVQIDIRLDAAVTELTEILKKIDPDRTSDLWGTFFNGVPVAVFTRPILSRQLVKMSLWPAAIDDLPHPELKAYAVSLKPLLVEAKAAEDAADTAAQKLRNWRTLGGYSDHIARSNADRTAAHGTLADLPHQQPALRLPPDYAERFFLHDSTRRGAGKLRTSAQIKEERDRVAGELQSLDEELKEAVTREQDDAKREEQAAKDREELAAIDTQDEQNAARKKELQKKLGLSKKRRK